MATAAVAWPDLREHPDPRDREHLLDVAAAGGHDPDGLSDHPQYIRLICSDYNEACFEVQDLKRQLAEARRDLAVQRGLVQQREKDLAAERDRHQITAFNLEAAGDNEHSPRAGMAVVLDAYETRPSRADLSAGMSLGARLAMTDRPCASLAVMADALTEPDRSVLDLCEDEPDARATQPIAPVTMAEIVGGGR